VTLRKNIPLAQQTGSFIAVDWGTTSLRAYLCNALTAPVATQKINAGIQSRHGTFETTLIDAIADLPAVAGAPVLMAGMIGSRQGWLEAPYVETPCTVARLAQHLTDVPNAMGRIVKIVPGLCDLSGFAPDVMRGEETQLLGLLQRHAHRFETVCMPGTHCKWVQMSATDIVGFKTYMTGEVFHLLCQHSILSRLMVDGRDDEQWSSFDQGLEIADSSGHLLNHLFSARTLGLFERMPADHIRTYLSGMLIGHEIRAAAATIRGPVALVGDRHLTSRYQRALSRLHIAHELVEEDIIVAGLTVIARAARLI
jgi:2-dehydro-3-deoxygalactonokinase